MEKVTCLIIFLILIIDTPTQAQDSVLVFHPAQEAIFMGKSASLLVDSKGTLTIDDILGDSCQSLFQQSEQEIFSRPASNTIYWFKLTINNQSGERLWLEIGDRISPKYTKFYLPNSKGQYLQAYNGSKLYNDSDKIFPISVYHVPIEAKSGAISYYLRSDGLFPRVHRFKISNANSLYQDSREVDAASLLFIGLVFGIIVYNLFLFFSSKDKIYLIYALERIFLTLTLTFDTGYLIFYHEWLWEQYFWWHNWVFVLQVVFLIYYLDIHEYSAKFSRWLWVLAGAMLLPAILSTFVEFCILINIFQIFLLFFYINLLGSGIYIWMKGGKKAKLYVLIWGLAILGVFVFIAGLNGLIELTPVVKNAVYIGFGAESILFALALGNRLNVLKTTNERILSENVELMQHQQEKLEELVMERTHQLSNEKQRAEHTLRVLTTAQSQLIQAEKMSSLGMLTAGIAHEINNPINYVSVGTRTLQEFIVDLELLVNAYVAIEEAPTMEERQEKEIHLSLIKQELGEPKEVIKDVMEMLETIDMGASRIVEIIKGLRGFSRAEEEFKRKANIHELIGSSLILLSEKYKSRVSIVKDFDDSLPLFSCYSGPLSQVFLNLIANAIDAIPAEGSITISTNKTKDSIEITIADTGTGIPKEVLDRIFEPLFTTKELGKGTGLGLSIVHDIIEKHGGVIEVETTEGEGTAFHITLPIAA